MNKEERNYWELRYELFKDEMKSRKRFEKILISTVILFGVILLIYVFVYYRLWVWKQMNEAENKVISIWENDLLPNEISEYSEIVIRKSALDMFLFELNELLEVLEKWTLKI